MAIREAYENLARFDPEQHWLTFEQKWDWNTRMNVVVPIVEDKPTGIIGYIIRLVYEYIWKPESLTLEKVVPHFHSFIVLAQDMQGRGGLQLDPIQMYETAEKIYGHFFSKCNRRRDLYRSNLPIFANLQRFQGEQAAKLEELSDPRPPSSEGAYREEIAAVAARHRLTRAASEIARGSIKEELDQIPGLNEVSICDRLKVYLETVEPRYNVTSASQSLFGRPARRGFFSTTRIDLGVFKQEFKSRVLLSILADAPDFLSDSPYLADARKYRLKAIACMVRYFDAKMENMEDATQLEKIQIKQEMTLFLVKLRDAFLGCINLSSTAIENLYYEICAPDLADARMLRKAKVVLEGLRRRVRDYAITCHLSANADHATSMNYYRRRLNDQMAISGSLSDLDSEYLSSADSGKDRDILETFENSYTTEGALNEFLGVIMGEKGAGEITSGQFREWAVREQLGGDERRWKELIFRDDDARWHPKAVAKMLVQLGLFIEIRSAF